MTRQPDSAVHRRRSTLPEHPVDHDTSADVDLRAGAVDGGSGRSKLRGMKQFRRIVAAVIACTAFAALACRREKPVAAADSAATRPVAGSDSTPARAPSTWDPGAGALLLVATDSPTKALVVLPTESDTTPIADDPASRKRHALRPRRKRADRRSSKCARLARLPSSRRSRPRHRRMPGASVSSAASSRRSPWTRPPRSITRIRPSSWHR